MWFLLACLLTSYLPVEHHDLRGGKATRITITNIQHPTCECDTREEVTARQISNVRAELFATVLTYYLHTYSKNYIAAQYIQYILTAGRA